jgi:DMSO/TMAO reductase YedYZ molybdopterin-dependent catalytic subunit
MNRITVALITLALAALISCTQARGSGQQANDEDQSTMEELAGIEIREYKGEKLGSINDFRENSIKGPQHVDIEKYKLVISGLVEKPAEYTYDEVLQNQKYSNVITIYCVEGWSVKLLWEGVLVKDLLEEADVKHEANTVIFHAYDGYTTSLPLDYILDNDILIAHKMNEVVLPPERGFPFQLVAEDKLGYKWIKWLTEIELSDNPQYKGFWESRGYSNEADIN